VSFARIVKTIHSFEENSGISILSWCSVVKRALRGKKKQYRAIVPVTLKKTVDVTQQFHEK